MSHTRTSWQGFPSAALPLFSRGMTIVLLLAALAFLSVFIVLVTIRLAYPFELEWIEGGNIDQVRWILDGNPLYTEPDIRFIPAAYNPLFFYTSALFMKVAGIGFAAARLVSVGSTIGSILLFFLIVKTETRQTSAGIISAGLFAASYRFTGAWLDLAKTDSLFLLLILIAFIIGRRATNNLGRVSSGILFILAYFTKQIALPFIIVLAPFSLMATRGKSWLQWLTVAIIGVPVMMGIDWITEGWFSFYTIDNFTRHQRLYDPELFWRPVVKQLWPTLIIMIYYISAKISQKPTKNVLRDEAFWHHLGFCIAAILTSWFVFTKVWTYDNGFIPAVAGLSLVAGLVYGQTLSSSHRNESNILKGFLTIGVSILLLTQFVILRYSPTNQLPSRLDREAMEGFVERLQSIPGEVLVYKHGFVNYLSGKTTYFHSVFLGDVIGGVVPPRTEDNTWRFEQVRDTFQQAIEEQFFEWVIVGERAVGSFSPYYIEVGEDPVHFHPATGAPGEWEFFLRRNPIARGGEFPLLDNSFSHSLSPGWSEPRDGRRYIIGEEASIAVYLESDHAYDVAIEIEPSCTGPTTAGKLSILWTDYFFEEHAFTSCSPEILHLRIPPEYIENGSNLLTFNIDRSVHDRDQDANEQNGVIDLGIRSISFIQKAP
jgi:hypothetical protein